MLLCKKQPQIKDTLQIILLQRETMLEGKVKDRSNDEQNTQPLGKLLQGVESIIPTIVLT